MSHTGEAGWPSASELELLRACMLAPDEATEAWRRWRGMVDFDEISYASMRQLPLAWRNLGESVADDPVWGRVRGIYRRSWSSNQITLRSAPALVEALEGAGIETLILKGAAASILHYRDLGARWMSDVDVLVDVSRLADASRVLAEAGWSPNGGDPVEISPVRHSSDYLSPDSKRHLDLHWHALWLPAPDEDFWEASVPMDLFGVPTRALCDADQVLHACVHGLEWNPGQLHWVADVHTVIEGGGVGWSRLVERARARGVTVFCSEALGYVRDELGTSVPSDVIEELRASSPFPGERAMFEALMRPPAPLRTARVFRDMYRRQHDLGVPGPRASSYPDYMRRAFGAESYGAFLGIAVKRAFGRNVRT